MSVGGSHLHRLGGRVIRLLRRTVGAEFEVQVVAGSYRRTVLARRCARMVTNHIDLVPGDRIEVLMHLWSTTATIVHRVRSGEAVYRPRAAA